MFGNFFEGVSVTIILGALWKLYIHKRGRIFERKLLIDVEPSFKSLNEYRLLSVDVRLTNAGGVKLEAKNVGEDDVVYEDAFERLKYACSLQVKRLNPQKLKEERSVGWYDSDALEPVPNLPAEINLLDEYLLPNEGNKTAFWMEPGDVVYLPTTLVLRPADYLLKVSFYGTNPIKDFWSRQTHVRVE